MGTDDDRDEQEMLMHALQAPGTPAELAEEDRYREMFRAAQPEQPVAPVTRLRSRTPRRVVVGGAAAAALALATGGVAAAYTGSLPHPIQQLAHHVIGAPPAAPAPAPSPDQAGPVAPSTTQGSSTPAPTQSGSARPHRSPSRSPRPSLTPTASGLPATPGASGSVTPSPSPSDLSPTPTPTPTPLVTGVTISGTSHRADVGARVRFTAEVMTTAATPNPAQKVVLQQRFGGRWARVATGVSGPQGTVTLSSLPLERSSEFRFRSGSVHSTTWRVAMHPLLSVGAAATKKRAVITVRANGARPGDVVLLMARRKGRLVEVNRTWLAADGTAAFTVHPATRNSRFTVVLPPTRRHTDSRAVVQVTLPDRTS